MPAEKQVRLDEGLPLGCAAAGNDKAGALARPMPLNALVIRTVGWVMGNTPQAGTPADQDSAIDTLRLLMKRHLT